MTRPVSHKAGRAACLSQARSARGKWETWAPGRSVYDGIRGDGLCLGRGCVDQAEPLDGQTLSLTLLP